MRLETTPSINEIVEMVEKSRENEQRLRLLVIDYFEQLINETIRIPKERMNLYEK
jgi:hypothetical protein